MVKPQARRCVVCMSMSSMCGRCLLTVGLAATASSPRTVDIAIDIVSNHIYRCTMEEHQRPHLHFISNVIGICISAHELVPLPAQEQDAGASSYRYVGSGLCGVGAAVSRWEAGS